MSDARYDAARAAALAGCGQGKDADKLDDKERTVWRRQALEWLRQDLGRLSKTLDNGDGRTASQIRLRQRHWQIDDDFARLREPAELAKIGADERRVCLAPWDEVADAIIRHADAR